MSFEQAFELIKPIQEEFFAIIVCSISLHDWSYFEHYLL